MKFISNFFDSRKQLLAFFNIQEEWYFYPILDFTQFDWYIDEDSLLYSVDDKKFKAKLFIHPDNANSVFRRLDYTAVCIEFYTCKVIAILDNARELTAWKIAQTI